MSIRRAFSTRSSARNQLKQASLHATLSLSLCTLRTGRPVLVNARHWSPLATSSPQRQTVSLSHTPPQLRHTGLESTNWPKGAHFFKIHATFRHSNWPKPAQSRPLIANRKLDASAPKTLSLSWLLALCSWPLHFISGQIASSFWRHSAALELPALESSSCRKTLSPKLRARNEVARFSSPPASHLLHWPKTNTRN